MQRERDALNKTHDYNTHQSSSNLQKENGGENCTGDLKQALTLLSPGSKKNIKIKYEGSEVRTRADSVQQILSLPP